MHEWEAALYWEEQEGNKGIDTGKISAYQEI
jgi:hypothetical protein